jgi:LPXTG-site transpeptidase (sortase) family protein
MTKPSGFKLFFATLWRQKAGRILLISAGVLLLAAIGAFAGIYLEGPAAERNAQQLLAHYQQQGATSQQPPQTTPGSEAQSSAEATPVPTLGTIDGYQVIGTLTLEKTAQTLPVISETSDQALKVSVCWYQGALPGEKGNMVITGHDYASGAHFGQLSKLSAGDRVTFNTPEKLYTYEVYDTEIIKPDQPEKLNEYDGDTVLTLLTCTSHGNRRLVVRCRLVDLPGGLPCCLPQETPAQN